MRQLSPFSAHSLIPEPLIIEIKKKNEPTLTQNTSYVPLFSLPQPYTQSLANNLTNTQRGQTSHNNPPSHTHTGLCIVTSQRTDHNTQPAPTPSTTRATARASAHTLPQLDMHTGSLHAHSFPFPRVVPTPLATLLSW